MRRIYTAAFALVCLFERVRPDCLPTIPLALDDIHDGDQKQIKSITRDTFLIQPLPNTSEWEIEGTFDVNCVALIDFNVPGKPNPPPVPLEMTMWIMQSVAMPSAVKLGFEFTDPSETLAPKTQPLNVWVSPVLTEASAPPELPGTFLSSHKKKHSRSQSDECLYTPNGQPEIFYDIKVSDMKDVIVDGEKLVIEPDNDNESWVIDSTFTKGCVTEVNFNVPGYPDPPSASEIGSVWEMASIAGAEKDSIVYTEPSAEPSIGSPLNVWLPGN